jgi:hypothetical protein
MMVNASLRSGKPTACFAVPDGIGTSSLLGRSRWSATPSPGWPPQTTLMLIGRPPALSRSPRPPLHHSLHPHHQDRNPNLNPASPRLARTKPTYSPLPATAVASTSPAKPASYSIHTSTTPERQPSGEWPALRATRPTTRTSGIAQPRSTKSRSSPNTPQV